MPKKKLPELYHGTQRIMKGRLTGTTDTDYFYFFCPHCLEGNNERTVMRYMSYKIEIDKPAELVNKYELVPEYDREFSIWINLFCQKCGMYDMVKMGNMGWQMGDVTRVFDKDTLPERYWSNEYWYGQEGKIPRSPCPVPEEAE